MEYIKDIVRALPNVASSPFAFVGYALVTVAWMVIALKVQRNKNLLTNLKSLPPQDRLPALRDEMGTVPLREGLSPEEYLKSRIHLYYFLAFALLCVTVILVFVVASVQSKTPVSDNIKVFGKVFRVGDRRAGVPNAKVYLEQEVTRSTTTTDNGEFVFEFPRETMNRQATTWAAADKFAPSKPINFVVQPLEKIFIPLEPFTDPTPTPMVKPEGRSSKIVEPKSDSKPNVSAANTESRSNCFGTKLNISPLRTEVAPGGVARFSTLGVKGGNGFGEVSYVWKASAGRVTQSGLNAQLNTTGVANCTVINVQVMAKNENGNCSAASGSSKVLVSIISQPCPR